MSAGESMPPKSRTVGAADGGLPDSGGAAIGLGMENCEASGFGESACAAAAAASSSAISAARALARRQKKTTSATTTMTTTPPMTPPTMAPTGVATEAGAGAGRKSDSHDGRPGADPHAAPLTEP